MKISGKFVAVLALLGSTVATAATVTVTPSIVSSAATPIATGTNFSVTISSADMSVTTGATLGVTFDPTVISIGTAAAIAPNFNFAVYTPTGVGTGLISVISTSALGIAGPFQAVTLNLTAVNPSTTAASANLVFVDDQLDLGWSDVNAALIPGLSYQQATIYTATTVPAPATVWLLATALGAVGFKTKRRLAKV